MIKKILLTGATDGIGLETVRKLAKDNHHLLLHGRNAQKLDKITQELSQVTTVESFVADLSDLNAVKSLAEAIKQKHSSLDVLVNNAGVLQAQSSITESGIDIRFVVNTIAPYFLTKQLLPILPESARIINLSSAAQASVSLEALIGKADEVLDPMNAYAQSKLAITMWSRALAESFANSGPSIIAINPGSLLGSKMVKEGFGIPGKDINIGADIIVQAALSDKFSNKTGKYYDNDSGSFSDPHADALSSAKTTEVMRVLNTLSKRHGIL